MDGFLFRFFASFDFVNLLTSIFMTSSPDFPGLIRLLTKMIRLVSNEIQACCRRNRRRADSESKVREFFQKAHLIHLIQFSFELSFLIAMRREYRRVYCIQRIPALPYRDCNCHKPAIFNLFLLVSSM